MVLLLLSFLLLFLLFSNVITVGIIVFCYCISCCCFVTRVVVAGAFIAATGIDVAVLLLL